jgi:hypothetical protein
LSAVVEITLAGFKLRTYSIANYFLNSGIPAIRGKEICSQIPENYKLLKFQYALSLITLVAIAVW